MNQTTPSGIPCGPLGQPPGPAAFATTEWSVVCAARECERTAARQALSRLCETYWYPLYAYVRRRGHSAEDAQDLTQEFFARLLEHNWLARADRSKGRFRSFLLMVIKRFLANEWDKARAQKRGGNVRIESFSYETAEATYATQPTTTTTPELAFEREWALALLDQALRLLGEEYAQSGKQALFEGLKACLQAGQESQPYAVLAAQLGMSEGAVKTAVCRLRQRFRERLRQEVARTVTSPDQVDQELRHLFRVLAKG